MQMPGNIFLMEQFRYLHKGRVHKGMNKYPRRYPPVGPRSTPAPPIKPENTGKPIKPDKRYIKQLKSPNLAFKRNVVRNTASKPNEMGTGLNGSTIAIGPKMHVTAVANPTKERVAAVVDL